MDRHIEILELLAAQERALQGLYLLFAETFPEAAPLWSGIAAEEATHADWLDAMRDECLAGRQKPGLTRITPAAIKSNIAYMDEIARRCREGRLDCPGALAIAVDIEEGLTEKKFFSSIDFCGRPLAMLRLEAASAAHRLRLSKALDAMRG